MVHRGGAEDAARCIGRFLAGHAAVARRNTHPVQVGRVHGRCCRALSLHCVEVGLVAVHDYVESIREVAFRRSSEAIASLFRPIDEAYCVRFVTPADFSDRHYVEILLVPQQADRRADRGSIDGVNHLEAAHFRGEVAVPALHGRRTVDDTPDLLLVKWGRSSLARSRGTMPCAMIGVQALRRDRARPDSVSHGTGWHI